MAEGVQENVTERPSSKKKKAKRAKDERNLKTRAEEDEAAQKERGRRVVTEDMVAFTRERFPNLQTQTYFVPPLLFNKSMDTPHSKYTVPVQDKPAVSDLGCDRAESDVMRCLRHIEDVTPKPMFIFFNYVFDNYLLKNLRQVQLQSKNVSSLASGEGTTEPEPNTTSNAEADPANTASATTSTNNKPKKRGKSRTEEDFRKHFKKAKDLFPTPEDLETKYNRGDFDTLIVSRRYGLIVLETKAIGYNEEHDKMALQERVSRAVNQLEKSETVLRHMFSDLVENVAVTKTLALPNVQRFKLQDMVDSVPEVATELCDSFEVENVKEAIARILCADDLLELPEEGEQQKSGQRETISHPILQWWSHVTGSLAQGTEAADFPNDGTTEELSADLYEKIVSRLVGPYSKLTVERRKDAPEARTAADCIHLTGLRFGRNILRPDQLEVLESQDKFVFLTGPPGSGKTLILGLKAAEWAENGDHVIIIRREGVGWGSLVSYTLYNQVINILKPSTAPKKKQGSAGRKRKDSSKKDNERGSSKTDGEGGVLAEGNTAPTELGESSSTDNVEPLSEGNTLQKNEPRLGLSYSSENPGMIGSESISDEPTALSNPTEVCRSLGHGEENDPQLSCDVTAENDDASKRVHCQTVSKDTDSEMFVQDLLAKHKGQSIRLVADECPSKISPVRLHSMLSGCHMRLQIVKSTFGELLEAEEGKNLRGESTSSGLPIEAGESSGGDNVSSAKAYMGKIERHLSAIKDRLRLFQPPHGKPSVTQTAEWQLPVTSSLDTCQEIELLLDKTQKLVPGSGQSTDLGDNSVKLLEKIEGTMLDASGLLFNVETSLGSFVLSDVFLAIRTQYVDEDITVWSSGVFPGYQPEGFVQKRLTQCVRCPPRVQKVLEATEVDILDHPGYTYQCRSVIGNMYPLPTDGPEVKLLDHSSHVPRVKDINDCSACAEALADYIETILHDGRDSGLAIEDVVISGSFDISGISCQFLQTLEGRKIPMEYENETLVSPPPYPGKAFVIGGSALQGLEAKVVVFVPDVSRISSDKGDKKQFRPDLPQWLRDLGRWNRCHLWFVASRCLSQLVVFHV